IFMLAAPESLEALNAPMDAASARELLTLVPDDFRRQLYEQALSPHTLTMLLVAAHMVIFWLSQDSNVTPPVCLTAFAAAAIARTPPMRTGFTAWKIAKGLYIIPLLFVWSPLIGGTPLEMVTVFAFALFGIYAIIAGLELPWWLRLAMFPMGALMLWPHGQLALDFLGLALFLATLAWSARAGRASAAPLATSGHA
ncbi:MAG: TRAP transporter permease, partial [Halomonas sp. BM-2019]